MPLQEREREDGTINPVLVIVLVFVTDPAIVITGSGVAVAPVSPSAVTVPLVPIFSVPASRVDLLRHILLHVCRPTNNWTNKVIAERYNIIHELIYWSYNDMSKWCEVRTILPAIRGGCNFGDLNTRNIQALSYYAKDLHKRRIGIKPLYFTPEVLLEYK